jgi:hypothetical protein
MAVNFKTETCPACGADWRGEEIPAEERHLYEGNSTHFSRLIAADRAWECPDCRKQWPRPEGGVVLDA